MTINLAKVFFLTGSENHLVAHERKSKEQSEIDQGSSAYKQAEPPDPLGSTDKQECQGRYAA